MTDAAMMRLRAARARVSYVRPYFAHAAFRLVPVMDTRCPTMAVDEFKRLYWNPQFVTKCSVEELTSVIIHEIGHVLRDHCPRARRAGITSATMKAAQIAQDCELNDDFEEERIRLEDLARLPGNFWLPQHIGCDDNLTWEAYFQKMLSHPETVPGAGLGDIFVSDEGDPGDGDDSEGDRGASDRGDGSRPVPDCGSGAHGVRRPWERGEDSDVETVSDCDWRDVKQQTALAIAERQRARGDVPGHWQEWANTLLLPRTIPWDQELSGGLRWASSDTAGRVIHTYSRPSRRQSASPDIILPNMRQPKPFVVIIGDTSSSMQEDDLALVRGTTEEICQSIGARVAFLATDAAVHGGVQTVQSGRHVKLLGRGGTNMCAGIEYAMTFLRPKPDVIVVATDCGTLWPALRPRAKVIVCAVNAAEDDVARVPQWARAIRVQTPRKAA